MSLSFGEELEPGCTLAIIGSRDVPETAENVGLLYDLIVHYIEPALTWFDNIVSGGASGADALAKRIATVEHYKFIEHPVNREAVKQLTTTGLSWRAAFAREAYGRNARIARDADIGLALITKPLRESRGTAHTVSLLKAQGKPVLVYRI